MKRKILGTFISRIIIAFSSLLVLIITSRVLGPEVRGTISLLLLAMTITVLINEIVAGPALVYFFPRANHLKIFLYAFVWASIWSVLIPVILWFMNLLPGEFLGWIILIIIFQSISGISMFYQLGIESAKRYNILALIQSLVNPVALIILIYFLNISSIYSWLIAVASAQILSALTGISFISKQKSTINSGSGISIDKMVQYGLLAQLSTLSYILSTRISYYFLDAAETRESVGIFSTAVSVTEAALLFSSSVALMTYSKIANSEDEAYNLKITSSLSKLTLMITFPLMLALVLLPEQFYTFILGDGFKGVKDVMYFLLPGVTVISMSTIFTHYFSGKALYKVNVFASLTGLVVSVILATLLIPSFGTTGASVTTSSGYIASGIFTILYFRKKHKDESVRLMPSSEDVKGLLAALKKN